MKGQNAVTIDIYKKPKNAKNNFMQQRAKTMNI